MDYSGEEEHCRKHVTAMWFRHGLRFHDNPTLIKALKTTKTFYPIFIFDGKVAGTSLIAYPRMTFLLECLHDLDQTCKKYGSRLYVFHGSPVEVFSQLKKDWGITQIAFEQDTEPIWFERDKTVKDFCEESHIEYVEEIGHTLWDPREVIELNKGSPPVTYGLFNQVTSILGPPPRPVADPDFTGINLPVTPDHDQYRIPTGEELGVKKENDVLECQKQYIGGETQALKLLAGRIPVEEKAFKLGFVMPNQARPNIVDPPLSMSPHLRYGCLSVRKFFWEIRDAHFRVCPNKPLPEGATSQLIWREYFYTMSVNNIAYDTMKENPICLNIPWKKDPEMFNTWEKGMTGFPWIDACMRQLRSEGWIHHVCRHAVACFLTRGDLWISWEEGLRTFLTYLLDADWSVCAGNWMWVSSSAFERILQCSKCFCPVGYGRRIDPSGEFVRRYIPELKDMPLVFLYEPWKAPLETQQKANCVIGKDYPKPMVDHRKVSKENKEMMDGVMRFLKDKKISHCAPTNIEEVKSFVWVPQHTFCEMETDLKKL
ncbi:cryptochrome-1-like [Haliotis cracherodii]|uniref:cryptochrome-1-like n=1 Tax=Haliotis cracherodii TaxID=6455 RepID=UPI0039E781ED